MSRYGAMYSRFCGCMQPAPTTGPWQGPGPQKGPPDARGGARHASIAIVVETHSPNSGVDDAAPELALDGARAVWSSPDAQGGEAGAPGVEGAVALFAFTAGTAEEALRAHAALTARSAEEAVGEGRHLVDEAGVVSAVASAASTARSADCSRTCSSQCALS